MHPSLVLGPLLRYVDETSATIWVETQDRSEVAVRIGSRSWTADTFAVHRHHYALVVVDGLEPGSVQTYSVDIDGIEVWPDPDSALPASRIATVGTGKELRMAFGSCRMSLPHDAAANAEHGVDALRAYARRMSTTDPGEWPDLVLFLGDQVYADETSEEMQAFIAARRGLDEPPGTELKDFEEYTHLYHLAWTDPLNRWLLSTLPSAMIFDDHDIRDDWNTSAQWRREMARLSWWHGRIVGGLASYWIYQHLGNLSPAELIDDELWAQITAPQPDGAQPKDWGREFDAFAERADEHPDTYRWSFARDIGANRVVVVDSRAARVLQPEERSILDPAEMAWLDEQLRGDVDHLFIGTSLPFLLAPGLHHFEAWNEAVATGAWGSRAAVRGEKIRRAVDLEHWAAFHEGFQQVAAMTLEVATGKRGRAPGSVTFLSGDVHNSYIAEAAVDGDCRILQAVCSPIRNRLPGNVRFGMAALAHGVFTPLTKSLALLARVPDPILDWTITRGPWFDDNLATVETHGRRLTMKWEAGTADDDLKTVATFP